MLAIKETSRATVKIVPNFDKSRLVVCPYNASTPKITAVTKKILSIDDISYNTKIDESVIPVKAQYTKYSTYQLNN